VAGHAELRNVGANIPLKGRTDSRDPADFWPVRARLIVIELGSEMLLRSQRKLHHAFQELVRRQADEVVHDELLGV
jgi:hypothetical protein